ncbi:MAG: acyl-CoA thioesterase [Ectothiorhodospiraceae bacterium]|nr:acyl-CoA thioesterase [Ectothiorhodospiraceae bacterium]
MSSTGDVDLSRASIYPAWITDVIRYADLDPNGHVNNGAINAYFEDGRVRFRDEHLAHLGRDVLRGFVLVRYTVEYHAALHFPGEVRVGTTVLRVGRSSYTLGQGAFRDGHCVATAEVVTVHVPPESGRPAPLGEPLAQALATLGPRT